MLCFQSAAIAAPRGDEGDTRSIASHQRHETGGGGGGGAGWRFPDIFQRPRPGRVPAPQLEKVVPKAFSERDRPGGAGGRDAGQRERNQESGHKGHGGPQDL